MTERLLPTESTRGAADTLRSEVQDAVVSLDPPPQKLAEGRMIEPFAGDSQGRVRRVRRREIVLGGTALAAEAALAGCESQNIRSVRLNNNQEFSKAPEPKV